MERSVVTQKSKCTFRGFLYLRVLIRTPIDMPPSSKPGTASTSTSTAGPAKNDRHFPPDCLATDTMKQTVLFGSAGSIRFSSARPLLRPAGSANLQNFAR